MKRRPNGQGDYVRWDERFITRVNQNLGFGDWKLARKIVTAYGSALREEMIANEGKLYVPSLGTFSIIRKPSYKFWSAMFKKHCTTRASRRFHFRPARRLLLELNYEMDMQEEALRMLERVGSEFDALTDRRIR